MWRAPGLVSGLALRGCITLLLTVLPEVGWANQAVVPVAQTSAEGNSDNGIPFNCNFLAPSMRYQQVYAAGEVGTKVITTLAFRQDGTNGTAFAPTTIPGVTITLSSTSNGPDTLSTTFTNNVGADVTTVFSGSLTLSSAASAAVPRPFDIVIPLQTPFSFDSTKGKNLLLDVTIPTCTTTTQFDSQVGTGDSVSRVYAPTSAAATGTADVSSTGLVTQFTTPSVSSGGLGDALIFPLIETTNLDTLIAIESTFSRTALHKVRFRNAATGAPVLEFTLCLLANSTWTASVFRDGSVTKVTSTSTLLVNGDPTPLNTTLSGNPTRAYMEVIGLRAAASSGPSTDVCTDPSLGGDVPSVAMAGRAYFVKGDGSTPLIYGANAYSLKDFASAKIADGTVFGAEAVAQALLAQSNNTPGFQSTAFSTRYFVPADPYDAVTQVVLSFPTGPTSGGCPSCRVPSNLQIIPFTEPGAALSTINPPGDSSVVRVISLMSTDIANDSGLLAVFDASGFVPTPGVGFGINTTTPSAPLFFNALFPLDIF